MELGLIGLAGGAIAVLIAWLLKRRKGVTAAATKAAEAVVLKRALDESRERLLSGAGVTAKEVAALEVELADRKRELEEMRAKKHGNADIKHMLEELGL